MTDLIAGLKGLVHDLDAEFRDDPVELLEIGITWIIFSPILSIAFPAKLIWLASWLPWLSVIPEAAWIHYQLKSADRFTERYGFNPYDAALGWLLPWLFMGMSVVGLTSITNIKIQDGDMLLAVVGLSFIFLCAFSFALALVLYREYKPIRRKRVD